MNYQQGNRDLAIRQEIYNTQKNFSYKIKNKKNNIIINDKHSGCIDRIQNLTSELKRMTEALKETNLQVLNLKQEIQKPRVNQASSNDDVIQKIQVEGFKLDQYKLNKLEELNEMENDLNRQHKDLQAERNKIRL
ncbi:unnamed protein product (macronuclear) [Paramecium tetraurelia]|uniref:Uncharacterized protein n=1 Tax=Paramecium tetraurelia TaxID=5888 RepID=A0CVB6_PARTE|nr:uncharacterized protein GSPATT00010901001 [Paramecium tetraurelia]CAK74733.1 unnamed protein product [Paramecium tetraurelia]|eukprot:XP_001442130.1 hypothetical protein (macronuclear) [Paramecium tetraurelia strain d4-2]